MANPSIAGISMISITPRVDKLGEALKSWNRDGIDGATFKKIGKRADPVTLTCVRDTTTPGAHTTLCKAAQGTKVTVAYLDSSYNNLVVIKVLVTTAKKLRTPVGGVVGGNYLVTSSWTVQATE